MLGLVTSVQVAYAATLSTRKTYGHIMLSEDLQAVPAVAADLSTTDTWIFEINLTTNSSCSSCTITISDKQTSAKNLLDTVVLAANTHYVLVYPEGVKMKGGINWVAGTASTITASFSAWRTGP